MTLAIIIGIAILGFIVVAGLSASRSMNQDGGKKGPDGSGTDGAGGDGGGGADGGGD